MPEQAVKVARIGIPDNFADQYGTQDTLLAHWGLTVEALCQTMKKKLLRG
jgi:transketolase